MTGKIFSLLTRARGDAGEVCQPLDILPIKNAAILHIDIVGSTRLVQQDAMRAHRQIQQLYARLCRLCKSYNGIARELRGDAAVVEFESAEDALRAALSVQATHALLNRTRIGRVNPDIRCGISYGPVISDQRMITGQAVIRAQRIEQLAAPGSVLFDQSVFDQIGEPRNFDLLALQPRQLKGFDEVSAIYQASGLSDDIKAGSFSGFEALADTKIC